jgi:DNA (cytosine-5)-methyltransferase 1
VNMRNTTEQYYNGGTPKVNSITMSEQCREPNTLTLLVEDFRARTLALRGGGKGISGSRSGLWSEMLRIGGEGRPRYMLLENSPALTFRGLERVLCDLSQIGYNAEWQCLSNLFFGFPHRRDRIYIIAYPNKIGLQSDIQKHGTFDSIFKQRPSNSHHGYSLSKRILALPASDVVRNDDGFRHWSHRVGSIGNAVNPTVAHYLFECIKAHNKRLSNYNGQTPTK